MTDWRSAKCFSKREFATLCSQTCTSFRFPYRVADHHLDMADDACFLRAVCRRDLAAGKAMQTTAHFRRRQDIVTATRPGPCCRDAYSIMKAMLNET